MFTPLTPEQIRGIIEREFAKTPGTFSEIQIFDHAQVPRRRKYPSIEILMITPRGTEKNPRTVTAKQAFSIKLYVRIRGAGSNEVELQKSAEDAILTALDGTQLAGNYIFTENKTWSRPPDAIDRPVPHYQSSLEVFVTDIDPSSGAGTIVGKMTLTVPGLAGMQLLSKPVDRDVENVESIHDDTRTRKNVAPVSQSRKWYGVVERTSTRMSTLRSLKAARQKISVTVGRPTGNETFNGKITDLGDGGEYADIETITIGIEVIP